MESKQKKAAYLIDLVDIETQKGIMRLNQKLKGLEAEISTKLEFLNQNEDAEKREELNLLTQEIEKALFEIQRLMRTKVPDEVAEEMDLAQFLEINKTQLEKFRTIIQKNADDIVKIGEDI